MSRKMRMWYVCGIVALGLLVPGLVFAQEAPQVALQTELNLQNQAPSQAPDQDMSLDEKPITLEELKQMVGPNKVCGAPCGLGQPKCFVSCGDAASCWHGYCIFL